MIIEISQFINTIYTAHLNHDYQTSSSLVKEKEILIHKYVSEIETILREMNRAREEEMQFFTNTFHDIVNDYGFDKYNCIFWFLPPTLVLHEHFGTLTTASNLSFQVKVSILKKLFFNDLLFYYYDFCYRMDLEFSQKYIICETNFREIIGLLADVQETKTFSFEELGLNSLMQLADKTVGVYEFTQMLENIVCTSLKIDKYKLQQILYIDSNLEKDKNACIIGGVERKYQLINHYIKSYNKSMTEDEKSRLRSQSSVRNFKKDPLLSFENKYLDSITLNITEKYKKRLRSPGDKRFKTYKESVIIINSCKACKKYCIDMLKNVRCDSHQNMLNTIRAEYFGSMKNHWLVYSTLDMSRLFIRFFMLAL